jgi:spore germination protein YaaH
MGTIYTSYDWSLLSTVAFFALEIDGDGNIVDDHGWPWAGLIATAHANGVRVLATAVLFSNGALDILLSTPAKRQNAITNLVDAVVAAGADGINVDFEGVPGSRKLDLVTFLGDLRSGLDAAIADPYLSIATPAVDWNNAFDYDELALRCDHLAIMAYDYHWSGSPTTGPVAPLAGWGPYNVSWTIQDYLVWGAPAEKILLGAPYYGYRWRSESEQAGAATLSPGVARTFAQAVPEAQQSEPLWDEVSSTPWYRYVNTTWNQGWYDDAASLASKYDAVWDDSLGGVSIWALGYDGSRPELWDALAEAFGPTSVAVGDAVVRPGTRFVSLTPNPFRASTRLQLQVPASAPVQLNVYDVRGQRVRSLLRDGVGADHRDIVWNGLDDHGRAAPAGLYWIRLETPDSAHSVRVVRLR